MTDTPDIEARLAAMETMIAFLFASQHMLTADPAAALERLRQMIVAGKLTPPDTDPSPEAYAAATSRIVDRIVALQRDLPRRLVDG
jgi:hypothetical protein